MMRPSNYDKFPTVQAGDEKDCLKGWDEIGNALLSSLPDSGGVICVECYPGAFTDRIENSLRRVLAPCDVVRTSELLKDPDDVRNLLSPYLGSDPVFGRMNGITIQDYFDPVRIESASREIENNRAQRLLVIGVGASLLCDRPALIVYADMARWEIQQRWRRKEIGNLGLDNVEDTIGVKYKCGFFVEWRAADRLKKI